MASIYSFLNSQFQDLKQETKENKSFVPTILLLLSIPLSYAFSSISLGLFAAVSIFTFKKENFSIKKSLIPLLFLYLMMVLSLFWTLSFSRSAGALSKEISLLLIPICFFLFKPFSKDQVQKIMKYYSYGMVLFAIFYLIKATIRFIITKDSSVFFYHELVTKDVNAIHVSVYMALACIYFLVIQNKNSLEKASLLLLIVIIFMLASKNVAIVFFGLLIIYYFFYATISRKIKFLSIAGIVSVIVALSFVSQIRDRFLVEIKTNLTENTIADGTENDPNQVYNVSVRQAWKKQHFQPNDFFPGTAFRVYQIRVFKELFTEDDVFFTGYGLNASTFKIAEKAKQYNVHESYAGYNFHNQYVQNFAELGFFGFLALLILLFINTKNAFKTKYFLHIAFAILMITLFLTESFLWRQRGVIYFTLLYCIFNSGSLISANKKTL